MTDRATPNLPSRDFATTATFYRRLGFGIDFRDAGWMILKRGGITLEFFPHPEAGSDHELVQLLPETGPHLVGCLRPDQWLAIAHRHFLATSALDLQLLQGVQPIHALVVHALASLSELQVDHSATVASVPMRQLRDLLAQGFVAIVRWLVAQRARAHPHDPQRVPF